MIVKNAVIHKMITVSHFDENVTTKQAETADIEYSEEEHPVEEGQQLDYLLKILEQRLKSAGKGSSRFKNASSVTGSVGHFKKYMIGDLDFFELTKKLAKRLAAVAPTSSSGSYLTFFAYEVDGASFIFICALKLVDGVTIDADTMKVIDATSIRQENIHEGVRVSLDGFTKHCDDNARLNNYIDWINKRSSSVLSEYFQKILDIDTRIENTPQTRIFKKAVDKYVDQVVESMTDSLTETADFDGDVVRQNIKKAVYRLADERAQRYAELDFDDVDTVISGEITNFEYRHDESFIEFSSENYPDLSNLFKPTKNSTSRWGVVRGSVESDGKSQIKFEIDRAMLHDKQYFDYDKDEASITIKQVKPEFFKELK